MNLDGKKTILGGLLLVLAVAAEGLAEAYPEMLWLPAVASALTYGGTMLAGVGVYHKGVKATQASNTATTAQAGGNDA